MLLEMEGSESTSSSRSDEEFGMSGMMKDEDTEALGVPEEDMLEKDMLDEDMSDMVGCGRFRKRRERGGEGFRAAAVPLGLGGVRLAEAGREGRIADR